MKLLIDTQVFIWLINNDKQIGIKSKTLLNDASNQIYISYMSLFEMKVKASIGKLTYDDSVVDDLPRMGIELLMPAVGALADYKIYNTDNKDPFDNILIAVARSEKFTFMTSDPKILKASVQDLLLQNVRE